VEGSVWVASHSVGGEKQRLDPTTTAKLVPTGKFPLGSLIVVMDIRPGSADDPWLCSRATELTAAAPTGPSLLPPPCVGLYPTFSTVGQDYIPSGRPHKHLGLHISKVRIFCDLLSSPRPTGTPHTRAAPLSPLSPRGMTRSRPLSSTPSHVTSPTLHIPFTSLHIPVIPLVVLTSE